VSNNLFSPSWYRVAQLRPSVRAHTRFHRHHYRGQLWYVLQDPSSGRSHRLTPAAYQLAGLMNGERTTQQIWEDACTLLGDDGPTQDETIRLLGLLHAADLLRCDVTPDTAEILRRSQRRQGVEWWRRYLNPLSLRIPLVDPDAFLLRWMHLVRPLFSRAALVVWGLVVTVAAVLAVSHWPELSHGVGDALLDPRNLALLVVVYPLVKGLHELAHAFATRLGGGEVHEMGIMFLVLMPVPYVDASSATVFPDKRARMGVAAAGVMVELLLAALALFVWLAVEPGTVRLVAFNVMWICGVSTVLFNGNPLLRFDGYYVLADAIEIPNLATRSRQYLSYLGLHYLLGIERVRYPVTGRGEAPWFVCYGIAAFCYRIVITIGIALFVAGRFFSLGVLLALYAVGMGLGVPLLRLARWLFTTASFGNQRSEALVRAFAIAAVAAALLLVVPVPLSTIAQGIVWPPEGAQVRARADGFVLRVLVEANSRVQRGQPLVLTRDPELETRVEVLEAELRELRARHHSERTRDLVRAQITLDEIGSAAAALARARERVGDVTLRSPDDGTFLVAQLADDLAGRFLKQGELVGYVVRPFIGSARVAVPQSEIALVRGATRGVEVRLAGRADERLPSRILRHVPAASEQLPSRALGTAGGGAIPVDASVPEGLLTTEPVFQVDVALPEDAAVREIGARVHVRFDHGREPVATRIYLALRRLFLSRLGV